MKHSIHVDRLALEGEGVGRIHNHKQLSGKVAFLPYVLPGETVEGQLVQDKKSFSRWLPNQIQKPSNERVNPPCPHFFKPSSENKWCGGCDWQHIGIEAQQNFKKTLVVESIERIAGIYSPPVKNVLSSPDKWRFRNKVQVPVAQVGPKILAGFYAPGSHDVVPFDDCQIQPKLSNRILKVVMNYAIENKWQGYADKGHKGWLRHILIRTNRANQGLLVLITRDASFRDKSQFLQHVRNGLPELIGIHQNVQPSKSNVILGSHWTHLWGSKFIEEEIAGLHVDYSPSSFFQVNTGAAEILYQKAIELADLKKEDLVVDLYCGIGCLTMLAAKKAKHAVGLEIVSAAIRNAQKNAKQNQISNIEFEVGKAERFFSGSRMDWLKSEQKNLVVFVDPPRSGCDQRVIDSILRVDPKKIVYVSCNPATLSRDLKLLSKNFKLTTVLPVDLFPQTSHIEVIACLENRR